MNFLKSFKVKQPWLRGGLVGIVVCLALFFFYLAIYFPIATQLYNGQLPTAAMFLPILTGHFLPLFTSFIVPYGFLCKFTVATCTSWSVEPGTSSIPWTLESGEVGYCLEQSTAPTSFCANFSEGAGLIGLSLILLAIYFAIGATIGKIRARRK